MNHRRISTALSSVITSGAMLLLAAAGALAQDVPIVQPGAPGQKTTKLTAPQAVKLADTRYTADDVTFMRDMIHHHDQAVQMAGFVKDRTNLPELVAVAGRINASQADEIAFMQNWLQQRSESVPDAPTPKSKWCGPRAERAAVGHRPGPAIWLAVDQSGSKSPRSTSTHAMY